MKPRTDLPEFGQPTPDTPILRPNEQLRASVSVSASVFVPSAGDGGGVAVGAGDGGGDGAAVVGAAVLRFALQFLPPTRLRQLPLLLE